MFLVPELILTCLRLGTSLCLRFLCPPPHRSNYGPGAGAGCRTETLEKESS